MWIAVDISSLQAAAPVMHYYKEVFRHLAAEPGSHRFIFFSEDTQPAPPAGLSSPPIIISRPPGRGFLPHLYHRWFRLPALLKKQGAGLWVSSHRSRRVNTTIPQVILVTDDIISNKMLSRLKKSSGVILTSESERQRFLGLGVSAEKVSVVHPSAATAFIPVAGRQPVKEKYADGREYFFCSDLAGEQSLIHLLKAFSVFKKRQRSGMKLLALAPPQNQNRTEELLSRYKYREDVLLLPPPGLEETALITAAAYAVIVTGSGPASQIAMLEAMQCGIPAIVPDTAPVQELAADAALCYEEAGPAALGEKMMRVYTDESLRALHAEKGIQVTARLSVEKSAAALLTTLLKTLP